MRSNLKAFDLLSSLGVHPVLVDVGASAGAPEIWDAAVAQQSVYVAFDPDSRELRQSSGGKFFKEIVVNEAITSDPSSSSVEFFLTKFPFCSSTLQPDTDSLSNFHFHDLFTVEQQTTVRASTLDAVLKRLSLDRLDWLKTDTQGTDLRIFASLSEPIRSRVLALDIEPGLIDAYRGEDLFVDAQAYLSRHGFWLSNLNVCGAVRVRHSTLKSLIPDESLHRAYADRAFKKTPAWCEARYLRSLESMMESHCGRTEYALLWLFAVLDGQMGFAMDVALEYERLFGRDEPGEWIKKQSLALIGNRHSEHLTVVKAKRWLKRILGRKGF